MRVVLDTNVIVSSVINRRGPSAALMREFSAGAFEAVTSAMLIHELFDVLPRPRLQRRHNWSDEQLRAFLRDFSKDADIVEPDVRLSVLLDDDDNRVLEAAVAGEADYVITGDGDFLALGEYRGIRIVTPAAFLVIVRMGPG